VVEVVEPGEGVRRQHSLCTAALGLERPEAVEGADVEHRLAVQVGQLVAVDDVGGVVRPLRADALPEVHGVVPAQLGDAFSHGGEVALGYGHHLIPLRPATVRANLGGSGGARCPP
jgi:hypothetical protein